MKLFAACTGPLRSPVEPSHRVSSGLQLGPRVDEVFEPSPEMLMRAQQLVEQKPLMRMPLSASEQLGSSQGFAGYGMAEGEQPGGRASGLQTGLEEDIRRCLENWLSQITAQMVLERACERCNISLQHIGKRQLPGLVDSLEQSAKLYLDQGTLRSLMNELRALDGHAYISSDPVRLEDNVGQFIAVEITDEGKIDQVHAEASMLSQDAGFNRIDAAKVAIVAAELARNIHHHASSGTVKLQIITNGIEIIAKDRGPGIPNLEALLEGQRSRQRSSNDLIECKMMMTTFDIQTTVGVGTTITATLLKTV